MHYVYVLKSELDGNLYTGRSSDLKMRFRQHCEGLVKSTKNRRPLKLLYYEAYLDKQDSINRELFLKSGRGREIIKQQLSESLKI